MRLLLIPVAIILAFQATTLFYSAHERHVFHHMIKTCTCYFK